MIWTTTDRARHFILPDGAELAPGGLALRTAAGRERSVDESAVAPYEVTEDEARDWAKAQLGDVLGEMREQTLGFVERLRQKTAEMRAENRRTWEQAVADAPPEVREAGAHLRDLLKDIGATLRQAARERGYTPDAEETPPASAGPSVADPSVTDPSAGAGPATSATDSASPLEGTAPATAPAASASSDPATAPAARAASSPAPSVVSEPPSAVADPPSAVDTSILHPLSTANPAPSANPSSAANPATTANSPSTADTPFAASPASAGDSAPASAEATPGGRPGAEA